jgi:hypothetical protein
VLYNFNSFNVDPSNPTATDRSHPDYLGRFVPYFFLDPTLSLVPEELGGPQGACNRLAYYIMQRIGQARKMFRFRAPLALVIDPENVRRRPLRMNDTVMVNGFPAVLKSVDLDAPLNASRMFAYYSGVFAGVGASIPM